MTDSHYTIEPLLAENMVILRLSGTWDRQVIATFTDDLTASVGRMIDHGVCPDRIGALVDMRRKNLLPQDVAATLGDVQRIGAAMRRIALMVSGTLHKMQIRRLLASDAMAFFEEEEEARAWLRADDVPVPAEQAA